MAMDAADAGGTGRADLKTARNNNQKLNGGTR